MSRKRTPPTPAVKRLSLYLRQLQQLAEQKIEKVSSGELARHLGLSDAQVRKDLGYFGQFGRRGVGYHVRALIEQLRQILGTDKAWNVVLVGAGDLGRALIRYRGFRQKGFRFVAAFDVASSKIGKRVGNVTIRGIDELEQVVRRYRVRLAVVTVPTQAAQQVTDRLCGAGVTGILNFAPITLRVNGRVTVGPVDLAAQLEQLCFRAGGGA